MTDTKSVDGSASSRDHDADRRRWGNTMSRRKSAKRLTARQRVLAQWPTARKMLTFVKRIDGRVAGSLMQEVIGAGVSTYLGENWQDAAKRLRRENKP